MSRMGSGGGGGGKKVGSWLWRAPRRVLVGARDLYMRSVTSCAGRFPSDATFGYPSFPGTAMSSRRSVDYCSSSYSASPFSSSRSLGADGDLRELMRAASERRAAPERVQDPAVARSRSVAMAKIDEDSPCDFGLAGPGAAAAFGRSRSCAVSAGGPRGRPAPMPVA